MIVLNGDLINQVFPACNPKRGLNIFNCIHIEDIEDKRIYVATNGHLLLKVWENIPFESEKLTTPLNITIKKKLKFKSIYSQFSLNIISESEKGLLMGNIETVSCDVYELPDYPDFERVIPKERTYLNKWIPFDVDYLKKVKDFLELPRCLPEPYSTDITAPAVWEKENGLACLMPCRL